jgi:hypothetical protein
MTARERLYLIELECGATFTSDRPPAWHVPGAFQVTLLRGESLNAAEVCPEHGRRERVVRVEPLQPRPRLWHIFFRPGRAITLPGDLPMEEALFLAGAAVQRSFPDWSPGDRPRPFWVEFETGGTLRTVYERKFQDGTGTGHGEPEPGR